MLLKIIDVAVENERESDYETAVDLSHWSMQSCAILFESPGGVRFVSTSRHEQVTHSYMEPDFDLLEETGQTVYQTHSDHSKDRFTDECYFSGLFVASPLKQVSASDFMMVFMESFDSAWDIYFDESMPRDVSLRVAAHLSGEDGRPRLAGLKFEGGDHLVQPNLIEVRLSQQDIESLCDLDVRVGAQSEVVLPPSLESAILVAEKRHAQIIANNSDVAANNRVEAAMARISLAINAQFLSAKEQTLRSFAEVREWAFPA